MDCRADAAGLSVGANLSRRADRRLPAAGPARPALRFADVNRAAGRAAPARDGSSAAIRFAGLAAIRFAVPSAIRFGDPIRIS